MSVAESVQSSWTAGHSAAGRVRRRCLEFLPQGRRVLLRTGRLQLPLKLHTEENLFCLCSQPYDYVSPANGSLSAGGVVLWGGWPKETRIGKFQVARCFFTMSPVAPGYVKAHIGAYRL